MEKQVVVARYEEHLRWLPECPYPVLVYDKNPYPLPGRVPLPNVGREAHTYLMHIVEKYDELADYTLFCQGWPFVHMGDRIMWNPSALWELLAQPLPPYLAIGNRKLWYEGRIENLRVDKLYRIMFNKPPPDHFRYTVGAQFVVSKERIRQRSVYYYCSLVEVLLGFPMGPWAFERLWAYLFMPKDSQEIHPW